MKIDEWGAPILSFGIAIKRQYTTTGSERFSSDKYMYIPKDCTLWCKHTNHAVLLIVLLHLQHHTPHMNDATDKLGDPIIVYHENYRRRAARPTNDLLH